MKRSKTVGDLVGLGHYESRKLLWAKRQACGVFPVPYPSPSSAAPRPLTPSTFGITDRGEDNDGRGTKLGGASDENGDTSRAQPPFRAHHPLDVAPSCPLSSTSLRDLPLSPTAVSAPAPTDTPSRSIASTPRTSPSQAAFPPPHPLWRQSSGSGMGQEMTYMMSSLTLVRREGGRRWAMFFWHGTDMPCLIATPHLNSNLPPFLP